MIRILHLTDFHLNNKTLRDWNEFYKDSFFDKLSELNQDKPIDLIAFTGDLIDMSGKDFGSATKGFHNFKEKVINPILDHLKLDISRFIICPGNHDINRSADDKIDENGLKATLIETQEILDFINTSQKNNSYKRIERIKEYKEFENELYKDIESEKIQDIFKFSVKINLNGKSVGVSSLNSSWRCYGDDDYKNLLIGENQLNGNFKFIKDCDIKIALIHHQLDWLSDVEFRTINSHINKEYDVILSGHVHEGLSSFITGFTGSCFYNVSPSGLNHIRVDNPRYANGFTIIDYNDSVNCHYLKYDHEQKLFVDNTDLVDSGKKVFAKPKVELDSHIAIRKEAINNIQEDHIDEMNSHFIKGKNDSEIICVKESFVFPPIDDGNNFYDQEESITTLKEIVNSKDNFLFLGPQEIGKKSLLYRVVVEYLEDFEIYKKIPVFIDFHEIRNKEIITVIKEYCRLSTEKVKNLLENGIFVLLIDNLNYHESRNLGAQINKLQKFVKDYPNLRIICSYEHDNVDILPAEIISHCKIPFSYHYIRGLRTREIKQIMKQWLPQNDTLKNEESLERLVNTFSSYHLPNNALSVHLYLWSVENSDRKPVNQAVLMEIYIELILEKLDKENIYRSSFDFTNKIQLISMIAEKIIKREDNNFKLTYVEFSNIINEYIKNLVGFSYDVSVIVDYLIDRKIFTKNNQNEVKFSHICFLHFFTAKRMQDNQDFKRFILDEVRYFNYPKEIDYYTGLVRSDKETFILLFDRFKALFNPMDFILQDVNPDDYFNIVLTKDLPKQKDKSEPIIRNIEIAKIKDSRPSDENIEKQYDEQLYRISNQKQELKGNQTIDFDRMMLIMCNVLRNSEGIEDLELKKEAYNNIIKHNITYAILYSQVLVRYVIENRCLPPSVPKDISLDVFLGNIPYHMQRSLFVHLGSQKLSSVILNKMKKDSAGQSFTHSDIEKFLSVTLYSDVYGNDFSVYLKKLIKSVKTVPTQNYLLFKLTQYLYKRSKSDTPNEELYLDLLSDLQIRTQNLPKRLKQSIIKDLKEKKEKMSKFIALR